MQLIHQMIPVSAKEFRTRVRAARRSLIPLSIAGLIVLSLPFLLVSSAPLRRWIGISEDMAGLSVFISFIAIPVFFLIAIRNVFWRYGLFCPRCGPRRVHVNFINHVLRRGLCPKCKCPIIAAPKLGSANRHS